MQNIFCGQCGKGFDTSEAELDHLCEVTGFKPTDPLFYGKEFEAVQASALARGEERKKQS